jgi:hypothetical protein
MSCQRCQSDRIVSVHGKCDDRCTVSMNGNEMNGYVPDDIGVGGSDYIEIDCCLNCGQLQGEFPLPPADIEKDITDEEVVEFFDNHFTQGQSISDIPRRRQYQMIDEAAHLSYSFRSFMKDFFDYNGDMYQKCKFPSVERFVQMFRGRDADLGSNE